MNAWSDMYRETLQFGARLILFLLFIGMLGMVGVAFTGCATERYLTEEQDAEFRANCEQYGCQVIPNPLWKQIETILIRIGAMRPS